MSAVDGNGRDEGEVVVALLDGLDATEPAAWAALQLVERLRERGVDARSEAASERPAPASGTVVAGLASGLLAGAVAEAGFEAPAGTEAFALLAPGAPGDVAVVGADAQGAAYGLLELADRVRYADDPLGELFAATSGSYAPATPVRSVMRTFVSEVQDKEWLYSERFWAEYLTELATQRINRFQLTLGMQYNYHHDPGVRDNYLCFPYPFLLDVPGFGISAQGVEAEERERNLNALRFASDEAKRRGIHFQLGLWNHAYDPGDSPDLRWPILGIDGQNHAAYCRGGLAQLLAECPSIAGLTLRVHYEGGISELGQERFWREVLAGVASAGRPLEVDMHAKGVDENMIDLGTEVASSLVISAKYWAEHQGLPYHQTTIRKMECALPDLGTGVDAKTQFTRRFTRYGYGDFLREDRPYGLIFRIWPGTQRLLLWGDPVLASGYGRLGTFAGALGIELSEPLSFKGRKDSGGPGERDPYVDPSLRLGLDDWKKYLYTYRLWGRLLYDPEAEASQWRRFLRHEHGDAALAVEAALGAASRVLPLVTVIHGIGVSNNGFWPEVYLNSPIASGRISDHYVVDTEPPGTFGSVSAFDPGLFLSVDGYVAEVLGGERSGKCTPVETAGWLYRLADEAERALGDASGAVADPSAPEFRRLAVDVRVQVGLARFYAGKALAGVAYGFYDRTHDVDYLDQAVVHYENARQAWSSIVTATEGVYQSDLEFGIRPSEHGHWATRLVDVDEDVAALRAQRDEAALSEKRSGGEVPAAPAAERPELEHRPPASFVPGEALEVEARVPASFAGRVVLHYRHVNQGEDYRTVELEPSGGRLAARIGGDYTASPYALVYYFTVHRDSGDAWLVPGLGPTLENQPYYLVRQRQAQRAARS